MGRSLDDLGKYGLEFVKTELMGPSEGFKMEVTAIWLRCKKCGYEMAFRNENLNDARMLYCMNPNSDCDLSCPRCGQPGESGWLCGECLKEDAS